MLLTDGRLYIGCQTVWISFKHCLLCLPVACNTCPHTTVTNTQQLQLMIAVINTFTYIHIKMQTYTNTKVMGVCVKRDMRT